MSLQNKKTMLYPRAYNKDGRHRRPIPRWIKLVIGIILFSLWVSIGIGYIISRTKKVKVYGTVVSHHITNDKYGDPTYYTIIKTDDGQIMTKRGLNYYVIKENDRIVIDDYVFE